MKPTKPKKTGGTGKRSYVPEIILTLVFLVGVGFLVYPTFSDWWNSFQRENTTVPWQRKGSGGN